MPHTPGPWALRNLEFPTTYSWHVIHKGKEPLAAIFWRPRPEDKGERDAVLAREAADAELIRSAPDLLDLLARTLALPGLDPALRKDISASLARLGMLPRFRPGRALPHPGPYVPERWIFETESATHIIPIP